MRKQRISIKKRKEYKQGGSEQNEQNLGGPREEGAKAIRVEIPRLKVELKNTAPEGKERVGKKKGDRFRSKSEEN